MILKKESAGVLSETDIGGNFFVDCVGFITIELFCSLYSFLGMSCITNNLDICIEVVLWRCTSDCFNF